MKKKKKINADDICYFLCGKKLKQFSKEFAKNLIINLKNTTSTFHIGKKEPKSNSGPWLKDNKEWYIFNDNTGRYEPCKKPKKI